MPHCGAWAFWGESGVEERVDPHRTRPRRRQRRGGSAPRSGGGACPGTRLCPSRNPTDGTASMIAMHQTQSVGFYAEFFFMLAALPSSTLPNFGYHCCAAAYPCMLSSVRPSQSARLRGSDRTEALWSMQCAMNGRGSTEIPILIPSSQETARVIILYWFHRLCGPKKTKKTEVGYLQTS